ncbi:unnamed protein product [Polarella glacialis]|uniref:Uncharacterized protein n=1 Tax=Polarella glacialis TaxID=89957 RepID=A0A813DKQ5_POLGL|nr:unnamed protein product [Polarella glacialis]CAE8717660.1 unnamed protein product [Polarella glacialis]
MFSSTCRFEEADETYMPFVRSPEADVERLRFISSLHIEPSVFCYSSLSPPIFTLSRLFPEVKVANTFIHVKSRDPDAFVARRSASSPPKIFKVISFSKQQQSEAVRPEANQGGVASAEHVGLESPGPAADHRRKGPSEEVPGASRRAGSSGYQRFTTGANASRAHGSPQTEAAIAAWTATSAICARQAKGSGPYFPATADC